MTHISMLISVIVENSVVISVGLYFCGVFLFTLFKSRKIKHDVFFVHGRQTNTFLLVLSSLSTAIGGGTIFTLVQFGYVQGLSAMIIPVAIGGGLIFASFIGGKIREVGKTENLFTLPEFLEKKFDAKTKTVAVLVNLVSYLFLSALQILALAALGTIFFGLNLEIAILLSWLIVIAYTIIGGLRGDIITDAIQSVFIIPIIFILFYYGIKFGGDLQALKTLDLSPFWQLKAVNPLLLLILALLVWVPSVIGSMDLWQRIYAAKSKKTAQRFLFRSGILLFFVLLLFSFIGIIFRNSDVLAGISPELISAKIISTIPSDWAPILLIGLLAAFMSTGDSMLMVLSATWTHDIYKPWKKVKDDELLKMGRVAIVLFGLLSAGLAWAFQDFVRLLGTALSSLAILTPAIFGGLYSTIPKPKAAFWSILSGFSVMILSIFLSFLLKSTAIVTLAQIFAFIVSLVVFIAIKK